MTAWYKEWFGEEYLDLYAHRDAGEAEEHVDFVERVFAGTASRAVLDLACGAGRHTDALRRRGYRALGVDLSRTLLAQSPGLPRVAGDMRCLPFRGESFDWVLNFFTSFGYFETERENFRVLEEVVRLLTPGGHFLIDLFNPSHVLSNLEAREQRELNGTAVHIERWFDERTRRINKRIHLGAPAGAGRSFLESVRAYTLEEVVMSFGQAGLEVAGSYGGFDGGPVEDASPRLIVLGRKPE